MPPRRAATASSSLSSTKSSLSSTSLKRTANKSAARRRHHGWDNDSASKHSHSSLEVLLAWLTTAGNYSRWAARSSGSSHQSAKGSGEGRLSLCKEVNALLRRGGIAHRKDMDVYAKIVVIEKSFHAAKKWLEETALMPKFLHGSAGKDVEANVYQLCRHYKELAPAFAATNNETAAAEVVDIDGDEDEDDDEEDGGDKSDTTTNTDDAEEKPRAHGETAANETAREERAPSRDETVNESVNKISSSQPELYTLSPVHDETPAAVNTSSANASPQQQAAESRTPRAVTNRRVQEDEYEETKENGPPEPDPQDSQRSSPSPGSPNKLKRIRQRISSQLSDDEVEPPVQSASPQPSQQKQNGTPIAPPSALTFTRALVTVQRGDVGSPASEKTAAAARQIEKPSIAPKRKTSGLLKDAIAASSAELSPPSARKKQKTQWMEQQELKKQQQLQIEQGEEKLVKQLQHEYHKKTQLQQQEELKKKKQQQQEELKKKQQLHQEELKKKHQQRQEELSKKKQLEHERKKQQELDELKKKSQRREDLLMKKKQQEEAELNKKQQVLDELKKRQQRREDLLTKKKKQQEEDELNKKQQQQEETHKKPSAVSIQPVSKSLEGFESQHEQPKQRHPDELQAILRACEVENKHRHTLFDLECDNLMQELEEKKIKVIYETALARKKLLDIGVAQSEVDRILPL